MILICFCIHLPMILFYSKGSGGSHFFVQKSTLGVPHDQEKVYAGPLQSVGPKIDLSEII